MRLSFSPRDWLLWMPVIPPLVVGLAAYWLGLHYRGFDGVTLGFALLGPWGACAGMFTGQVAARLHLKQAVVWTATLMLLTPVTVGILTSAVCAPLVLLLQKKGSHPSQVALVVMTWWYLISAATGAEMLDRILKRITGSAYETSES